MRKLTHWRLTNGVRVGADDSGNVVIDVPVATRLTVTDIDDLITTLRWARVMARVEEANAALERDVERVLNRE